MFNRSLTAPVDGVVCTPVGTGLLVGVATAFEAPVVVGVATAFEALVAAGVGVEAAVDVLVEETELDGSVVAVP